MKGNGRLAYPTTQGVSKTRGVEEARDRRAGPSDSFTGFPPTLGGASSSAELGALLVCFALPPEPERGILGLGPR